MFDFCFRLPSITIPDSVTSIGESVFNYCEGLTEVVLPASLTVLGNKAFYYCTGLTEITIPSGVSTISLSAFCGCSNLVTVNLPAQVTSISESAFARCSSLKNIDLSHVQSIGFYAFKGCTSLETVNVERLTDFGNNAFEGCSSLREIPCIDKQTINGEAFKNCTALEKITMTYTVRTIGVGAFENCPDNMTVYFLGTQENWDSIDILAINDALQTAQVIFVNVPQNVSFPSGLYDVGVGKTIPVEYTVMPADALTDHLIWTSEDTSVATVDDMGNVTGVSPGQTVIRVRTPFGDSSAECVVQVVIPVTGLRLSRNVLRLAVQDTYRLEAVVSPENATELSVHWSSDNEDIATVDDNGVVTAVSEGTATITVVTNDGGFTAQCKVTVAPQGIFVKDLEENYEYTGKAIKPVIRVFDSGTLLTNKTDYTVTYKNTTKAYHVEDPDNPTATDKKKAPQVIIKTNKKGNYKGTETIYFSIEPLDINDEQITVDELSAQAGSKPINPVPVVYFNGKKLKNKTDYTVNYNGWDGLTPGDPTILIQGKGNFAGTREATVHVAPIGSISLSKLKVTSKTVKYTDLTGTDFINEIASQIVVKNGKTTVPADAYTVEDYPEDYKKIGTVKFTIAGNEEAGYYGKRTVSVKITGVSLSDKKVKAVTGLSYPYTGEPRTFTPETHLLTHNGNPLTEGVDYEIVEDSYTKNIDAGKATVTVKGINNYTGTKKVTYTITPLILSDEQLIIVDPAVYCKGGSKPGIYVVNLIEGKDYTVKYSNNTKANAYGMAVITFKGNYKGSSPIPVTYYIKPKDISEVTMTVKDKVYSSKANGYKSKPVLKDVNGKTLKAGTDYETTYQYTTADGGELPAVVEAGTVVKVTVTGKGNYTGTISEEYRILNAGTDISKMTFKINSKEYTGSEITIEESDITSIKLGKKAHDLKLGTDYEIAGYTNNVKKGTAKVTFRGINGYGGTKTVSFKIGQRSIVDYWQGMFNAFNGLFRF